jgi:tetratricopeptide (TPR) repeat protein
MNKRTAGFIFALAAAAVLAWPGAAWPQFQGRLEGVVTDAAGTPLAKVAITIVSQRTTSMNYSLTTDASGKFVQVGMQPGYFQISFKKEGFMPKSSEIHVRIADVTRLEVQLEKASEVVEKAVSDADRVFLRGNKLYEEKKYEEAAAAFQDAIKLSGINWGYHLNLGLAYKKLERRGEALASFRKAVELNPESYSANKEMGEATAKEGAFEEAKAFYRKAVALSPDDPDAHFNLGACLLNTGQSEEALGHFLKTVELKPDYADALYQMGTIYIGLNKIPEATASLEKFLAMAPNHEKAPLAKQLLDYLKKSEISA